MHFMLVFLLFCVQGGRRGHAGRHGNGICPSLGLPSVFGGGGREGVRGGEGWSLKYSYKGANILPKHRKHASCMVAAIYVYP